MIVTVDQSSPVPAFEQVREQVATMIAAGVLPPGTSLPPIRQIAADLGIAPGTVARAYSELERAGLVGGRGRRGTRVLPRAVPGEVDAAALRAAARAFALRATQLGAQPGPAREAVRQALEEIELGLTTG